MFELHYSTGGHGGPYKSVFMAKTAALRHLAGNQNERWIDIKQRSKQIVVARIMRAHLSEFYAMGAKKAPRLTAIFQVNAVVVLDDVSDAELNNSEVLHSDVCDQLRKMLLAHHSGNIQITLVEAFELNEEGGEDEQK